MKHTVKSETEAKTTRKRHGTCSETSIEEESDTTKKKHNNEEETSSGKSKATTKRPGQARDRYRRRSRSETVTAT